MSSLANYSLDLPEEIYVKHGVSRKNKIHLDISKLKDGDIIFVKTDFIINGVFLRDYLPHIKTKFILITGTSDYSVDMNPNYLQIVENQYLIHWFANNPPLDKIKKISFLPIGFQEYERLGENLNFLKDNLKTEYLWENKKNRVYIPYHSQTNSYRKQIIEQLKFYDFIDVENHKLDFQDYIKKISEYKFVLSLRGNGWDCHRNYEVLFSGSIPILQRGPISKSFIENNIPFIKIDEIDSSIFNKKFTIDKNILSLDYWKKNIYEHL